MFYDEVKLDKEWVVEKKQGKYTEHELHMHEVLEIHVLRRNEAVFRLTDKQFDGRPGDVFLFRPFEPHWNLTKSPDKPIEWISILFSPSVVRLVPGGFRLLAPFYAIEAVSPHIPAETECARDIQRLAENAWNEETERRLGWESKQFVCCIEILVTLLRYHADAVLREYREDWGSGMLQTIEYLLAHFTEELNVDELVRITGRQRTFFFQSFKAMTGLTPNVFVHRLRIQMAQELLSRTSRSVLDIALDCGYHSHHTFDKTFKKLRGMSPREYRKQRAASP